MGSGTRNGREPQSRRGRLAALPGPLRRAARGLRRVAEHLRGSLWFQPSVIVAASVSLAVLMLWLDGRGFGALARNVPFLFGGDADSARSLLATIAGSMITVAGVVFSITIVVLTLASSQYSPRVIRSFMRDRLSQTVLGVFLGVFTYSLLVLGTVTGGEDGAVPALAVSGSVVLAVVGLGYLVAFIHHIARAIQAAHILATTANETLHAIEHLYPDGYGEACHDTGIASVQALWTQQATHVVRATCTGYIQSIALDSLLDRAAAEGVVLRIERRIGEFVPEETPLVSVLGEGSIATIERAVQRAVVVNRFQTVAQDVPYGIRQMVDVALRALSPALNDETTAAEAIDYIGAVLARLAAQPVPSAARCLDGEVRVLAPAPSMDEVVSLAFDQIVRVGAASPQTLQRVLGAVGAVREFDCESRCSPALQRVVRQVADAARRSVEDREQREAILAATSR